MKYDFIVAIDPDVNESGVAFLDVKARCITLYKLRFPQLVEFCKEKKDLPGMVAVVEAGWENRPNWHIRGYSARAAAAIGKQTGRNHEVGRLLVETLEYYGVPVHTQRPLIKCWKGKDKKITAEELRVFTGIKQRTNQDQRDAALLAWYKAGLPIVKRSGK